MRRALAAFAVMLSPAIARANQVDACVDAADHAQQLRDQGKLIEAREQLVTCSGASCPSAVVKQCARWLQEVDAEVPTLSLRARDATGADVADVAVLIDGNPRTDSLDGRPMTIDPGQHKLTFRRAGIEVEQSIVVRTGEKNRLVDVQLGKPEAPPPPPPPPPVAPPPGVPAPQVHHGFRFPWTTALFLGLGVAGFVTTGVLVAVAGSDASSLRSTCAPNCAGSDVDAVRTRIVVANVAFGVGIGATALSVLFLIIGNTSHHDAPVQVGLMLDHGFGASASARF